VYKRQDLGLPSALAALERAQPDIVEVLPGVIFPEIADQLRSRITVPMIVGGLIAERTQSEAVLRAGARAVTTSSVPLWP